MEATSVNKEMNEDKYPYSDMNVQIMPEVFILGCIYALLA